MSRRSSTSPSPARKPGRSYHHGDLRTALIESALAILDEKGPRGLTIREVATRVGVSHTAPYRHFRNKSELVTAVVERGFELLQETMAREQAAAGEDPLARFAAAGAAYIAFGRTWPAYYRVMFSGDLLNRDGDEALGHTSDTAFEDMTRTLEECQRQGIVPQADPKLQAVWIISAVHGFLSLANDRRIARFLGDDADDDAVLEYIMTAIYLGLGGLPGAGR